MRVVRALGIASVLLPASLQAGLIYGSIVRQGAAVSNTHVRIQCPGGAAEGDTAGDGSFRIQVQAEGRCTVSLRSFPGASTTVPSYAKPTQYDFELVPRPGGGFELRIR